MIRLKALEKEKNKETTNKSVLNDIHIMKYKKKVSVSTNLLINPYGLTQTFNDYKEHSKTLEAHNGTFKKIYNYNHIPIIGLKRIQNLMFTIIASYNLIRLFNLIKENKMNLSSAITAIISISQT